MRLRRLVLQDFGPYKGEQTLDFPPRGVTVVYGENMRGKTSLLNAVRYALFGRVLTRGARELALHLLTNWESAAEGRYGFQVRLLFEHEADEYELTRFVRPRTGVTLPTTDNDY